MMVFLVIAAVALLLQRADCWQVRLGNLTAEESGDEVLKQGVVYPSTKWCGPGNVVENYDDLGVFADTDRCCRAHDNCEQDIEAGQTMYGLTNNGLLTRVTCTCDQALYDCLKKANTAVSIQVGVAYFNVLSNKCFKEEKPIIKCSRYSPIIITRCLEYELDEGGEPIYQFFDIPVY